MICQHCSKECSGDVVLVGAHTPPTLMLRTSDRQISVGESRSLFFCDLDCLQEFLDDLVEDLISYRGRDD